MNEKIKKIVLLMAVFVSASEAVSGDFYPKEEYIHYETSWLKDMPLTFFTTFSSAFGYYRYTQMDKPDISDIPQKSELLPWDRPFMGRYSKNADNASRYMSILGVAPLVASGISWGVGDVRGVDFASFSLMLFQAFALQNGINLCVRSYEFWPRPYIYAVSGDGMKRKENAEAEAYGSFFSGHASAAFTIAVFTGEWFSEVYPNSPYKKIVWSLSLSLAMVESSLRVAAGKHYPTDVVVGALVGTGVSLAIIQVHKNNRLSLWAGLGTVGISVKI